MDIIFFFQILIKIQRKDYIEMDKINHNLHYKYQKQMNLKYWNICIII